MATNSELLVDAVKDIPSMLEFNGVDTTVKWVSELVHRTCTHLNNGAAQLGNSNGTIVLEERLIDWTNGDALKMMMAMHIASSHPDLKMLCILGTAHADQMGIEMPNVHRTVIDTLKNNNALAALMVEQFDIETDSNTYRIPLVSLTHFNGSKISVVPVSLGQYDSRSVYKRALEYDIVWIFNMTFGTLVSIHEYNTKFR